MSLLSYIRSAILINRSHPTLRNRLRALHLNRRLHMRRPYGV